MLHIPRTGGTSIRDGIWEGRYTRAERMPVGWGGYFSFSIVRHPLDRFLSCYALFKRRGKFVGSVQEFAEIVVDVSIDPTDAGWRQQGENAYRFEIRHLSLPQTHWYYDLDKAVRVLRFENYTTEVRSLMEELGVAAPAKMPKLKSSKHLSWSSVLPSDTVRVLTGYYALDFERLGYG